MEVPYILQLFPPDCCAFSHLNWGQDCVVLIRHNSDRLARLGRQAPQPTALKYDFFYTEQASKWKELSFFCLPKGQPPMIGLRCRLCRAVKKKIDYIYTEWQCVVKGCCLLRVLPLCIPSHNQTVLTGQSGKIDPVNIWIEAHKQNDHSGVSYC